MFVTCQQIRGVELGTGGRKSTQPSLDFSTAVGFGIHSKFSNIQMDAGLAVAMSRCFTNIANWSLSRVDQHC